MDSFHTWLEQKTQSTGKDEIVRHWQSLPPGMPMSKLRIVPSQHKGPTYGFDELRIEGSNAWIDFVLSRIKDVLVYEGNDTRLEVVYRQQINSRTQMGVPDSYVFYLQIKQREAPAVQPTKKINPQSFTTKKPKV